MKLLTQLIGLISAMVFTTGWVFSILYWPGATQLLVGGFLAFTFVYLPILSVAYFTNTGQRTKFERIKFFTGFVSGILVGISVLMKLFHLQGADLVLIAGCMLFIFGFLPAVFLMVYKNSIS